LTFVLDASVTLAWAFADESTPYAEAVFDRLRDSDAIVPHVWWLEVANALLVGERRNRMTVFRSEHFLDVLRSLPVNVGGGVGIAPVDRLLSLGRDLGLTVYDASYIELALRRGMPLATLDGRLRSAAERSGVALVTA
jgi:predicted nucleic acid-binding protein